MEMQCDLGEGDGSAFLGKKWLSKTQKSDNPAAASLRVRIEEVGLFICRARG